METSKGLAVALTLAVWTSVAVAARQFQAADCIKKLVLKSSAQNSSRVLVKGRGAGLPDLPLPTTARVTVRLVNGSNGLSWGWMRNGFRSIERRLYRRVDDRVLHPVARTS